MQRGEAQAGPSRPIKAQSTVIDLTVDDDDDEVEELIRISHKPAPTSSRGHQVQRSTPTLSTSTDCVMIDKASETAIRPRPSDSMKGKGRAVEVDTRARPSEDRKGKGRAVEAEGLPSRSSGSGQRSGEYAPNGHDRSKDPTAPVARSGESVNNRLMKRQYTTPSIPARSKTSTSTPTFAAKTAPARPIAGSSRATVSQQQLNTSQTAVGPSKTSWNHHAKVASHLPVAGRSKTAGQQQNVVPSRGSSSSTTLDNQTRVSADTSGTVSSATEWQRRMDQQQTRPAPSKPVDSLSSISRSGLASRDVRKKATAPRPELERIGAYVQPSGPSTTTRPQAVTGVKRTRSTAFDSPASQTPAPPSLPKGRQLGYTSSIEVKRTMSGTPQAATGGSMKRVDSSNSIFSGATPTPDARPVPSVREKEGFYQDLTDKTVKGRARQSSPLKQSSLTFGPSSTDVRPGQRMQPRASTPPSSPPGPRSDHSHRGTSANQFRAGVSPNYKASVIPARPKSSSSGRQEIAVAEVASRKLKPTTDSGYRLSTKSQRAEVKEEEGIPNRPKRARPATGAYTVPSMDAAAWPTSSGTLGAVSGKRKKRKSDLEGSSQANIPVITARSDHGTERSEGRTVASSSTQISTTSRVSASASASKMARPSVTPSRGSHSSTVPTGISDRMRSSATPSKSGILTPHRPKPNYRQPIATTPKPGRLASFTPSSSIQRRQGSHLMTPTPRRVRPATLTPKHERDGPDEAEEPVEEPDEGEIDLLAEFANYEFAPISPEQNTAHIAATEPTSPSNLIAVIPATPTSAARPPEPASSHRSRSKPRTPSSSSKRAPSVPASPHIRLFPKGASSNLAAAILARARATEEKAREEQERKAARRARMEALAAGSPEVPFQPLADISSALAAAGPVVDDQAEGEDSQASRLTTRAQSASLRTDNVKTNARSKEPKSKTKSKPGVRGDKKPKAASLTDTDRFFQEQNKEARKSGFQVGDLSNVLHALDRSTSPRSGVTQYPTPNSDTDSDADADSLESSSEAEEEEVAGLLDTTMGLLENDGDMDGLLDVAREIKDSKRNSARASVVDEVPVFWESPTVEQIDVGDDDLPVAEGQADLESLFGLVDIVPRALLPLLAKALPPPRTSPKSSTGFIGQELLYATMVESDACKRSILHAHLMHTLETSRQHPFQDSTQLYKSICRVWRSLGARPDLFPSSLTDDLPPVQVKVNRQEACSMICQIITTSIKCRRLSSEDTRLLVPSLLLLAIDPTTSAALRRTLDDTIAAAWTLDQATDSGSTEAEAERLSSHDMARILLDCTASYSLDIRTKVISAIGQRSGAAQSVAIWYATGLFLPAGLPIMDSPPSIPPIHMLMEAGEDLHLAINAPEPSHDQIENLITCLYTALSNIEQLVQLTPFNPSLQDDQHPIKDLRSSIKTMHDKLRASGDYAARARVSRMKARLQQLGVVLDMQFVTAFKRLKVERERARLGPGLRLGTGGQAMLAFSRDTTVSNDSGA